MISVRIIFIKTKFNHIKFPIRELKQKIKYILYVNLNNMIIFNINIKSAIQKCKILLLIFHLKNIGVENVRIKYLIHMHHMKKLQI